MSRACLFAAAIAAALAAALAADPSAAQKPNVPKVNFSVAQRRERPACVEEQVVYDWLFQRHVIESIPADERGNPIPGARATQRLRVEAWGPHLFNAAASAAEDWPDVTVFTGADDERAAASYIRVRFKILTPAAGRVAGEDHVFIVPAVKRRFVAITPIKAGDTWTKPFLDHWRKSGKKRRPVLDR